MTNSIRTPRQGVTANSKRIAQAVDQEEWQLFRLRMKGKSTQDKLDMLRAYFDEKVNGDCLDGTDSYDDVCIRVDNYIKALCRGGQLYAGESLETALTAKPAFGLRIKRN